MVKRLYTSVVLADKPDTGAEFCVVDAADYDRLESALLSLLPGLVLDRRYADADDDIEALNSRIETVQEALYPTASQNETKP